MTLNTTTHYHYAECHYADCCYAECRYAECRYAECRGAKQCSLNAYCDSIYFNCYNYEVRGYLKGDKLFIKRDKSFQKHSLVHQSMASLNGPVQ